MKKLFLILVCMIFLVGTVSAFDFDNKIKYKNNDMKVEFSNSIGIFGIGITTSELGIIELKSHKTVDEVLQFGFGKEEVVMYYDFKGWNLYENGLGEVHFTDMNTGKEIEKDYYFVEWKEGTWIKLDNFDIPNKDTRIGIKTYIGMGDYIDAIWTIASKEIDKHAAWGANLNVDLVSYYNLEDTETTTDGVGNYHGINYGADSDTGKLGDAYRFVEGNSDNVTISSDLSNVLDGDFTVSFWFNRDNDGTVEIMIDAQQIAAPSQGISIYTHNIKDLYAYVDIGTGAAVLTYDPMDTGVWYHVVFRRDGTNISLWVNNSLKDYNNTVGNDADVSSSDPVLLGADGAAPNFYDGMLDEIGFWERALSDAEIGELWNGGDGITYLSPLIITLNSPTDNYISIPLTITFNGSVYESIGNEIVNVSLYIDGVINETNSSGINNTDYIFTKTLLDGDYNWTYEACNNESDCRNVLVRDFTITEYLEISQTFNSYSYETKQETFSVNISARSLPTAGELIYNGTTYSGATITNTEGDNYNMSREITIPISPGNKTFYFNITIDGTEYKLSSQYQVISNAQLGLCNATLTAPYINFTFIDEETSLNINATIDTSTWVYWLGDGTVTKTLIYLNNTVNNFYAFCFSASDYILHNTRSVQYASPGYPQRKYDASNDLTNSTTNKVLYLLSSADGIYSTIQVLDTNSNQLPGTEVIAERQFSGIWTVVGQETTDSSGSVTFWLNPDYDHRFTFVKSGCTGTTITIRPTQTQYTQQLQCVGATSDYTATIEGLKYSRTPVGGILQAGTYNFTYYLVSSKDNIINASFYLINATDQTVLNSTVSACTSSGCLLYMMHVVSLGDNIKGKYYVDVGNGSILLEGDAWWRCVDIPTAGKAGIKTFFQDVIYVFQEWGSDTDTADFNRLVVIFFLMCISISVLNYHFNMDSLNPGMFLLIMTLVIVMGSIVGGASPTAANHGLFYYNNLTTNTFINNYLLAFIMVLISFASFLNINRQAQR